MTTERVEEFIGPAVISKFPWIAKGNADGRKMVLELVNDGRDEVEVLIPTPMDLVQSLTGYWFSTYNLDTDVSGKIVDPKTAKNKTPRMIPGKVKARKEFIRGLLFERTKVKPREFRVWKNADGQYVLFGDRPYRSPK